MDKQSRDGGFSDPSFVTVGDPYVQVRDKGRGIGGDLKPFLTCPPKKGQIAATFGAGYRKFEGLTGNYMEQYKLEAKRRLENTKKFVKPNGFVYSSPAKEQDCSFTWECSHSTGAGDYFGAFDKYERDEEDIKKAKEENELKKPSNVKGKEFEKKNILTNPGKRGTFGYAGTLIGGNMEALAAEFDSQRLQARKDEQKHKELMGDRKPFKSTTAGVDYFDSHEHVAASKGLGWDENCVVKPVDETEMMVPRVRVAAKASTFKPWKPNNPPKGGEEGTFEKFPERLPEPYDEAIVNRAMLPNRRNPVKIAMKDLPESMKERKAFKPGNFPKTKLTKGTCLLGISKHHL
ncbi:TPA: hypothetical protein N0F65_012566 [Lagenidium giganteum]|uniref:Cilia-and flagella-associated protein 96 n=1 Tax=Lagenidium giganteum TaxID=4803 RepID=A0AAV2YSJ3_9STRA|nr:TPA: hypothetical protein N0F65_012566 [Lagenidium giganteum]